MNSTGPGSDGLGRTSIDLTFADVMSNDVAVSNFLGQISPIRYLLPFLLIPLSLGKLKKLRTFIVEKRFVK